ncbi:MAG TPA: universal stress protein [Candidatus Limnocylindrales bacterium]|jgi:nucleotide-binding universal stress UspA family protein|nr:universal stress protein [Candidatus Limnocylindrales bacterium]
MPESNAPPFTRAVVGLNGGPTDDLVVQIACQLAKPTNAELIAVHVVEVDWTHELSDDVAGREEAATILDRAEAIADRHKVKLQGELLQARDVGAALVDEAVELGADALFLGLPYRKRFGGDFALGTTLPYVLQNAPGQVHVVREAVATSEQRGTQEVHPYEAGATSRAER